MTRVGFAAEQEKRLDEIETRVLGCALIAGVPSKRLRYVRLVYLADMDREDTGWVFWNPLRLWRPDVCLGSSAFVGPEGYLRKKRDLGETILHELIHVGMGFFRDTWIGIYEDWLCPNKRWPSHVIADEAVNLWAKVTK